MRKILAAWPLAEVRRFFETDLGVPLKVEAETGKLFPVSDRARTVLDALLTAVTQRGVRLQLGARVTGLARAGDGWLVRLADGETIGAGRVILAAGGLSIPATGSDGAGLRMAQALGHTLVPPYPALVPLTGSNPGASGVGGRLAAGDDLGGGTQRPDKPGIPGRGGRSWPGRPAGSSSPIAATAARPC